MTEIVADDQAERDEQILRLRVGGASPRAIAKELHCSVIDVNAAGRQQMCKAPLVPPILV